MTYAGFDIDGAIYPCHRFNKFDDNRDWQNKEVCIGHIDHGITNLDFRDQFINWKPQNCGNCERFKDTPCHGGCYAVNYDFTKDIRIAHKGLCQYTQKQKNVSEYYRQKFPMEMAQQRGRPCVCYNLCYLEDTDYLMMLDRSGIQCMCYQVNYMGPKDPSLAKPVRFDSIRRGNVI
jgi:radical SAM protein with 4Fe4S-binding SPASM domain